MPVNRDHIDPYNRRCYYSGCPYVFKSQTDESTSF